MRGVTVNGVQQWPTRPIRLWELDLVARKLRQAKGAPLDILEIGSLVGDSARVLAPYGSLTCVDTWEFGVREFQQNTRDLNIRAVQGDSTVVLPALKRRSFDLIYVDGCHVWPVVDEDLRQAKRLIRKGGVICGDDLERVITSDSDAAPLVPFRHMDYLHDEGGFHPGVSLAVFHAFGAVEMREGFWWVQR